MRNNTTNTPNTTEPVKPLERVVPRGKAIERTDSEIDDMTSAEAMQALAEDAAVDWRENAPKLFEGLLGEP